MLGFIKMNPNKNPNIFAPQEALLKTCNTCHYICSKSSEWHRHLLTRKHMALTNPNTECIEKSPTSGQAYECKCGKKYRHRSTLSHHKKICGDAQPNITAYSSQPTHQPEPTPKASSDDLQTNLILELVKQNHEFKQLLIEQNKTIIEVAKNSQVNNTISNSNNNNKTFNMNVFLNETCKDAMNMKDFIKSLELSLPELEKMGEVGFAEGMSRVFVDRLNSLDITKRPIHCSDVKREIIHIKDDNKWERDNANLDRLRKIIKQLTHKNILRVDDWKKANPGCTEYNSRKNVQYLRINMEAIGPVDQAEEKRDFGKIIRRVAENTAIDKKYLCV